MLAIKESVTDMSPYVRKTAATAIPKLYSLDPEQKEQLEEVIEKLLKDQTTVSWIDFPWVYVWRGWPHLNLIIPLPLSFLLVPLSLL